MAAMPFDVVCYSFNMNYFNHGVVPFKVSAVFGLALFSVDKAHKIMVK